MDEKVDSVFTQVLSIGPDVDRSTLEYNVTPGWDSVAHMALVAGLEAQFDCMLEIEDILDMRNYEKVVEIMTKYV